VSERPAAAEPLSFHHRWKPGTRALTLLLLHGTGGNEDDLLPLGDLLAPRANLLAPRGQVLENGMPRFFRRIAEGVFDVPDLLKRTDDLAAFLAAAERVYPIERSSLVAVGFSNGANIAGSLVLKHPGALAGALLLRPMVPFVPDPLPRLNATPVLVAAGRADPIAPPDQAEALAALLKKCGADVEIGWAAGAHAIGRDDLAAARAWMDRKFPAA